MCLSWISVADKPGYDKGRESVAPEEKLWVIKLRQSCHLRGLNLVNFILNSRFCLRVSYSGLWNVTFICLMAASTRPCKAVCSSPCQRKMTVPMENTYAHPGVVCGDVVEMSSYLIMLLAKILKCPYCLLEAVVADGEGQVKDIGNEIGRWGT